MEYGLIGEKLGHSYSKLIHEKLGYYSYDLVEISKDRLESFIKEKDFKGINVTIPYKEAVIPFLDFIDEGAKAIGAVNTIVNKAGKLYGYNTDFYGLLNLLKETGFDFAGKKVLVLGTGGTCKTAKAVLEALRVKDIVVVSRSKSDNTVTYEEACEYHKDADFIVNTTPSGMYPNIEAQAIDLSGFSKLSGVADVIYNPLRTRILLQAESMNIPAYSGLKMLVYQAIVAAEYFLDKKIDIKVSDSIFKYVRSLNENIVLIGMPGAGKTTIGKKLSKLLNMDFVDTDALIEKRENRKITDIFSQSGEGYFRDTEAAIVKEVSGLKKTIIATGGGAILRKESVLNLKAYGRLVFLNRKPSALVPTDDRPLADSDDKMVKLYQERLPIYESICDISVDGELGIDGEIEEIVRYMDEH